MPTPVLRLGAHTSTAGGHAQALHQGAAIGATTIQLFTASPRQWKARPITDAQACLFRETKAQLGFPEVMSHASYLLNLGSPDQEARAKSLTAFQSEIGRCLQLGVDLLNIHPGAARQGSKEACLAHIVESLLATRTQLAGGDLHVLIEMTAGQGSTVGASLEEIGYILQHTAGQLPIGVCVDTCHIFAAGYDIRTPEGWESFLAAFEAQIGLDFLMAFHLNDSLHPLGSRKDRHAPLGEGHIGWPAFHYLVTSPTTRQKIMCLETPGGPPLWRKEIAQLRGYLGTQ